MTQPNPTPTDALREAYLKILKGAFNIGWQQGEKEMGRGSGGESYRDNGKVKEMLDADVEKLIALLPPPDAAVQAALSKIDTLSQYTDGNPTGQLFAIQQIVREHRQALATPAPAIKEALCEWRPIAEWDEMKPKDRPQRALFWFKASESGGARLAPTIKEGRFYGYRECTHFMPIEPPTQGGEHE